jgi:leucyl-tRNA synthetase
MSKSRGNVINPDDYDADPLRLYEMFMGPLEQVKPWSTSGVEGITRFLNRVWRMIVDEEAEITQLNASVQNSAPTADQERLMHRTIKAVTEDIDRLAFNTAISRMMEFVNGMTSADVRPKALMESFVLLLSPFAPHIAEELWQVLGHSQSLAYEPWPVWDEAKLIESEVEVPVQFNGKLRATIKVPVGSDAAAIEAAARSNDRVQENLSGKTIVKVVCVPGRMINFVVK